MRVSLFSARSATNAYTTDFLCQVCNIEIESFGYDMTDLAFDWSRMAAVELSRRIELPQFVLKGYRTADCMKSADKFRSMILIFPRAILS